MSREFSILICRKSKGIKFGTRNPVNYFDQFYNAELFLRAHGSYSIRIVDPLPLLRRGCAEKRIPRRDRGYQRAVYERIFRGPAVLDQSDGSRRHPHFVPQHPRAPSCPATWQMRWMRAGGQCAAWRSSPWQSQSLSYDEASQKLIQMRNEGAMMSDPSIREGYVRERWHAVWRKQQPTQTEP